MNSYRRKILGGMLLFPKSGAFASLGCMTYIPKRSDVRCVIFPWTITSQQEYLCNQPGKHILNDFSVRAFVTWRKPCAVANPSYLLQPEPIVP